MPGAAAHVASSHSHGVRLHAWLCLVLALLVVGCGRSEPPELLQIHAVTPGDVEVGDRLEVAGSGFPVGKRATVTLIGTLHRPDDEPVEGVSITLDGESRSATRVSVQVPKAAQGRLCLDLDHPVHTTFRGAISVAFAPRTPGAPPVLGRRSSVVLNFFPGNGDRVDSEARVARAEEVMAALGFEAKGPATPGPLTVGPVASGGPAEAAGLAPGDLIVTARALDVRGVVDVVPSPADARLDLDVLRADSVRPLRVSIDTRALSAGLPASLARPLVLVWALALALGLGAGVAATGQALLVRRVVTKLTRARVPRGTLAALRHIVRDLLARRHGAFWSVTVPVAALLTALATGRTFITPEIDLAVILLSAMTLVMLGHLVVGGLDARATWSLRGGLIAAGARLLWLVPAVCALGAVATATGSFEFQELNRLQGAEPWRWHVARSPGLALGALMLIASAVPSVPERGKLADADVALEHRVADGTHIRRLAALGEHAYGLLVTGLAVVLFFGAWQSPMLAPVGLAIDWVGVPWLLLKWAALRALLGVFGWALPPLTSRQLSGLLVRRILPLCALTVGLTQVWHVADGVLPLRAPLRLLAGLFALSLVGLVIDTAWRCRLLGSGPVVRSGVNPWI